MRIYTAIGSHAGLAAADDVLQITAPADKVVFLRRAWIGQDSSTTADQIRAVIQRASAAGTGGAVTPEAHDPGDPAAGSTVLTNTTGNATLAGAPLVSEGFDARAGWLWVADPTAAIILGGQDVIVLRVEDGPTTSADFEVGFEFAEVG